MKYATSDKLADLVGRLVRSSPLAKRFDHVDVGVGDYDDESQFIRVTVHLNNLDDLLDDDVDAVVSSIETAVAQQDDRFPSVRFAEN